MCEETKRTERHTYYELLAYYNSTIYHKRTLSQEAFQRIMLRISEERAEHYDSTFQHTYSAFPVFIIHE